MLELSWWLDRLVPILLGLIPAAITTVLSIVFNGTSRLRRRIAADGEIVNTISSSRDRMSFKESINDRAMLLLSREKHPFLTAMDVAALAFSYGILGAVTAMIIFDASQSRLGPPSDEGIPFEEAVLVMMAFAFVYPILYLVYDAATLRTVERLSFVRQRVRDVTIVVEECRRDRVINGIAQVLMVAVATASIGGAWATVTFTAGWPVQALALGLVAALVVVGLIWTAKANNAVWETLRGFIEHDDAAGEAIYRRIYRFSRRRESQQQWLERLQADRERRERKQLSRQLKRDEKAKREKEKQAAEQDEAARSPGS